MEISFNKFLKLIIIRSQYSGFCSNNIVEISFNKFLKLIIIRSRTGDNVEISFFSF